MADKTSIFINSDLNQFKQTKLTYKVKQNIYMLLCMEYMHARVRMCVFVSIIVDIAVTGLCFRTPVSLASVSVACNGFWFTDLLIIFPHSVKITGATKTRSKHK